MGVEMRCAVRDGVVNSDMPLEPLVQVTSLSDIDRNPTAILGLSGINLIARQCLEGSIHRVYFVWILFAGLTGPVNGCRSGALRLVMTTEQAF